MSNKQNYISDELTHFVGKSKNNDNERFQLLIHIIKEGVLRAPNLPNGVLLSYSINPNKEFSTNEMYNPSMVCFCDIPLSDMEIHIKKYSKFGLSFHKNFLINQGVNPVRYIAKNAIDAIHSNRTSGRTYNKYMKIYNRFFDDLINKKILTPKELRECYIVKDFIDRYEFSYHKFYNSKLTYKNCKNYYMEREWRSLTNIHFSINDIYRVILPVYYIKKFTDEIPEYCGHITTL